MATITAAIMAKNEAHDIEACIQSVLWMDEVIVLDSGSTDGTLEICKKYAPKVKLYSTDWPGFGEQSNRCLEMCTTDWCYLADADERVTPQLQTEIIQTINNIPSCDVFRIPRLNYFMGRAMVHCLSPKGDQPIRLIKKGAGRYTAIVHPKFITDSKIGTLQNHMLHYPFKNLAEILEKANSYSTAGATLLIEKNVKPGIAKTFGHAIWAFIRLYFIKRGFLDGWPGFLISFNAAEYTFYRYAKMMEKQQ